MLKRLAILGSAPALAGLGPARGVRAAGGPGGAIDPALARELMAHAFEMRRIAVEAGDQPYGAVVVRGTRVVGEGPSRVVTEGDPTAHAEVVAIRDAAKRLGTRDLSDCVMLGTSRACRMCETAAYWARISRLVNGQQLHDAGAPGYEDC